jgi:hypothetical protein
MPLAAPSGAIKRLIAFIVYTICAKDAPNRPPVKGLLEYLSVLHIGDAARLRSPFRLGSLICPQIS